MPAFNAGAKSIDETPFEEAVHYTCWGIAASYFKYDKPVYYSAPPRAYAIISHNCPVAYVVMVEMIGCNFVSFLTKPFFLGSPEHRQSIAYLEKLEDSVLPSNRIHTAATNYEALVPSNDLVSNPTRPGIRYTKLPFQNLFIKFIAANAYSAGSKYNPSSPQVRIPDDLLQPIRMAEQDWIRMLGEEKADICDWDITPTVFYHLFKIYCHYLPKCSHPCLVSSQMKFGFFDVAIESPFILGRRITVNELRYDQQIIGQLCSCLKELARNQLLYIDLRQPNILIEKDASTGLDATPKRVRLIDFDDCVILSERLCCGRAVHSALRANDHMEKYIMSFSVDVHGLDGIFTHLNNDVCANCGLSSSTTCANVGDA
jgi:hypothetical protein